MVESERMSDEEVERMAAGARSEGYDSSAEGVFVLLHQRDEARKGRDEARKRICRLENALRHIISNEPLLGAWYRRVAEECFEEPYFEGGGK